jgi:hypothetical protein
MSVTDCIPMLIPLVASMLALQFFSVLSSMIPVPSGIAQPFLTVLIMYIVTYLYAKVTRCWNSDKLIFARSFVPILIFIGWLVAFIFPLTSPFMMGIGNSPFLIVALSIIYKLSYDKMFGDC